MSVAISVSYTHLDVYKRQTLNIAKMWRMYQESVSDELKVKESLFRKIFVTNFNISFKSPTTDAVSYTHLDVYKRQL